MAMPPRLASTVSRWALARTWATVPGAEAMSGSKTVWTESITTSSGSCSSSSATRFGTADSDETSRPEADTPSRSARARTWASASSALT
jgi:hypothetical protein